MCRAPRLLNALMLSPASANCSSRWTNVVSYHSGLISQPML